MKMFKGVFPYMLTTGMVFMQSCGEMPPEPEHKAVVRVISKGEPCWFYCDKDGDSLVDFRLNISWINECFSDKNIHVGDTLVFNAFPEDLTARNVRINEYGLKSVNNRLIKEIRQAHELKKLRNMAAQEKVK